MNDFKVNPIPNKLLRAVDVADILNISKAFAYRLMKNGKIPTVNIQSAKRVRMEDLMAFIEDNIDQEGKSIFRDMS